MPLDGLRRTETRTFPLPAFREAVINALIHRDYGALGEEVQVRVYDDRIVILNPGGLLPGLRVADLLEEQHRSILRNPGLAQAFYYAGLLEKWGTGTTRMAAACREQGLPGPVFDSRDDRFSVTFEQNPFSAPRLRDRGFSERQITAIAAIHGRETITNRGYRELTGVTERTALRDLSNLVARGVLIRLNGAGRAATYGLASDAAVRPDKPDTNPT